MTRLLAVFLIVALGMLQWRYWRGDGGREEVARLSEELRRQQVRFEQFESRNATLEAEMLELKSGNTVIEELARSRFGMIREGEVFYQMREPLGPEPP